MLPDSALTTKLALLFRHRLQANARIMGCLDLGSGERYDLRLAAAAEDCARALTRIQDLAGLVLGMLLAAAQEYPTVLFRSASIDGGTSLEDVFDTVLAPPDLYSAADIQGRKATHPAVGCRTASSAARTYPTCFSG